MGIFFKILIASAFINIIEIISILCTDFSFSTIIFQCQEKLLKLHTDYVIIFFEVTSISSTIPLSGNSKTVSSFFIIIINDAVINIFAHHYLFTFQSTFLFSWTSEINVLRTPIPYLSAPVQDRILGLPCIWPRLASLQAPFSLRK